MRYAPLASLLLGMTLVATAQAETVRVVQAGSLLDRPGRVVKRSAPTDKPEAIARDIEKLL